MDDRSTAETAFVTVRRSFEGRPGVAEGRLFNSDGLSCGGRFFAALSNGEMLVKLPEDRVTELIRAGVGRPFDANRGRVMREWLLVPVVAVEHWPDVAEEAFAFASAQRKAKA